MYTIITMNLNPTHLVIGLVIFALAAVFTPVILNTRPKIHCTNLPDNAGGYYPVCTDPTFISVYTKYISKEY